MMKLTKIKYYLLAAVIVAAVVFGGIKLISPAQDTVLQPTGESYSGNSQWMVVNKFDGYETKFDETKINNGATGKGQNTTANDGDRISIRNLGYEPFPAGTASTATDKIVSIHTFRKRTGENVMMRTRLTFVEYYEEGNDTWEILGTGFTSGEKFGFADYNINVDLHSYTYFGNAVDEPKRWNGAHTLLNGGVTAGDTDITVDDTTDFSDSGTVIYCGVEQAYSSTTDPNIIHLTGTSTISCADNRGIAQAIESNAAAVKGNIYLAANNRLFIAGISSTSQAVYFSKYGDPTNWVGATLVTDTTDDSPGIFNIGAGGGAVTGMVLDENSIYIFKKSAIWRATLTDTLYTLTNLKAFDAKSQTIGSRSSANTFTGGNQVYFTTPDNQIMSLRRVETVDYPQIVPISNIIQPTVDSLDFSDSAGIVFRDRAFISCKQDSTDTNNNTVLVWNILDKTWDTPIIGWTVKDWTIYDDGSGEELYFASDSSSNVYKVTDEALDDTFPVTASWRSKQFVFGAPHKLKTMSNLFVEGYISQNTEITISLLLDENGYTQTFKTTLNGTDDSDYLFGSTEYNVFGLSAFGTNRFGSNQDFSGLRKFRIYLGKDFRVSPFYTAQLDIESDDENQNWEIISFGFKYRIYSQPEKRDLFKAFK